MPFSRCDSPGTKDYQTFIVVEETLFVIKGKGCRSPVASDILEVMALQSELTSKPMCRNSHKASM